MRFEQLYYFETLLQESSYNKAATKLHITQPALTASIKSMEKELGTTLLTRDTRGFTLTEDGQKVLAFSKTTLSLYDNLLNTIGNKPEPVSGSLAISASKFFTEIILESFLSTLREQFPFIKVRLIENDFQSSQQYLLSSSYQFVVISQLQTDEPDKCDSAMLEGYENFFDDQYQYLPLFTDVFGFTLAKHSPLAHQTTIYPDPLSQSEYPLTLFPFSQIQISDHVLLSSNNPQLHIDAMLHENAYCSIPYFVYQKLFAHEETLTYRAYTNNLNITYYLVYPTEHTLTPAEQVFIEELQHYLAQMKFK